MNRFSCTWSMYKHVHTSRTRARFRSEILQRKTFSHLSACDAYLKSKFWFLSSKLQIFCSILWRNIWEINDWVRYKYCSYNFQWLQYRSDFWSDQSVFFRSTDARTYLSAIKYRIMHVSELKIAFVNPCLMSTMHVRALAIYLLHRLVSGHRKLFTFNFKWYP